ncbi:hypothetical protein I4U23_026561 [Adineta vaga]|nr:hypothetical protein I4U23_026561 [Adineta vaga]
MQRWAGTYKWDNQCKVNHCCCYTGSLAVKASGSNLIFSSDTQGCGSSRSTTTFSNPNSYSFSTIGTRGSQITYSLSPDSNTLYVRNNGYSQCGGSAARTSTGTYTLPSVVSLVIIFTALWILL